MNTDIRVLFKGLERGSIPRLEIPVAGEVDSLFGSCITVLSERQEWGLRLKRHRWSDSKRKKYSYSTIEGGFSSARLGFLSTAAMDMFSLH